MSQKWVIKHLNKLENFCKNAKPKITQNALRLSQKKKKNWKLLVKNCQQSFFSQFFLRNFSVDFEKIFKSKLILSMVSYLTKSLIALIFVSKEVDKWFSKCFLDAGISLQLMLYWCWPLFGTNGDEKRQKIRIFCSEKANNRKFTWRL